MYICNKSYKTFRNDMKNIDKNGFNRDNCFAIYWRFITAYCHDQNVIFVFHY